MPDEDAAARAGLGRQLAASREAAGLTWHQLAAALAGEGRTLSPTPRPGSSAFPACSGGSVTRSSELAPR